MIDEYAKACLHEELQWTRKALVWKVDGLSEYDIRRPLTVTGTNLLGLVKHMATWEARYLGEIFNRPFADRSPGGKTPTATICGSPKPRAVSRSSTSTGALGSTRTPRSTNCPLTLPATCLGGRDLR